MGKLSLMCRCVRKQVSALKSNNWGTFRDDLKVSCIGENTVKLKIFCWCRVCAERELSYAHHENLNGSIVMNPSLTFFWVTLQSNRLKQVVDYLSKLNSLCSVLGVDYKDTICKIHPTLDSSKATKDVSNKTIEKLATTIHGLQEVKMQRMQKVCTYSYIMWFLS